MTNVIQLPLPKGRERFPSALPHFGTPEVEAILHHMLCTHNWAVPDQYEARWGNTSLPISVDELPITLERR